MNKTNSSLVCGNIKKTHPILFSHWWLWSQIHWKQTCTTSQNNPWATLWNLDRLDREKICWAHLRLGLSQEGGAYCYAGICSLSTSMVSTPPSKKATAPAAFTCAAKIWAKAIMVKPESNTPRSGKDQTKFVQEVTGTFLFYTQAVDSTMLTTLSAIASKQASST